MRRKELFFLIFVCTLSLYISCDSEEEEEEGMPNRLTQLIALHNDTGADGGCPAEPSVTFVISYRDVQVDASISEDNTGFVNVLVADGESINVQVRRTSDNNILSDADIDVRTTSRPGDQDAIRRIRYCESFNLEFENF